ncbi:hypothetical protein LQR31_06735 [Chromobacterium vaccinii]|uniref:hypothetical protein n=1 Tax=Chromobacterium vaccinii TaxID=1108595 RepID=UPI001E3969AE|nr:hypothetical protein [Chromobacterium vaccinii]MCD4484169.1 hypothetical protein [Chromobacterium vaccinii]
MTESPKADEPDWSGLNLPVLTEVVDEQAVPTLAEEASAEAQAEVPEFDFSSELDLLAAELDEDEPQLEIPELTLDELLEAPKPEAEPAGGLDFSGLPSLELADADIAADGEELGFVLEPKAEAQAPEADGLAELMARADPQPSGEAPFEPHSAAPAEDAAAEVVPDEMGWSDVVAAAGELPADAHQPAAESAPEELPALEPESAIETPPVEAELLPELPVPDAADSHEAPSAPEASPADAVPTAQAADASQPFTSISIDSLPSGVLGGGAGREPPPSSGLEWLSELPSQQQAEPPKPTIKDMIAEAERVLAEERAKQQAANREVAEAFGLPQREEPSIAAAQPIEVPVVAPEVPHAAEADSALPGAGLEAEIVQPTADIEQAQETAAADAVAHEAAPGLEGEAPQPFVDAPVEALAAMPLEQHQAIEQSVTEPVAAAEADMAQAMPEMEALTVPDEPSEAAEAEAALDPDMPVEALDADVPSLAAEALPVADAEPLVDSGLELASEPIELAADALAEDEAVLETTPLLVEQEAELEPVAESAPAPSIEAETPEDGASEQIEADAEQAESLATVPDVEQALGEGEPADAEFSPAEAEPFGETDLASSQDGAQPDVVIPSEPAALAESTVLEPAADVEPGFAEEASTDAMLPHAEMEASDESVPPQPSSLDGAQSDETAPSEPAAMTEPAALAGLVSDADPAHAEALDGFAEPAEADHSQAEPALDADLAALEAISLGAVLPELVPTPDAHAENVQAEPAAEEHGDAVSTLYEAVPQPAPLEDEDMPALSGLLGRSLAAPVPEDAPAPPQEMALDAPVSVVKVAAMSSAAGAGRQGPPATVLDEQALFNSLYERMLPRMKVELSLWLQDAIEVQAKQMLSGMMHQLKEDYEMLFGDALKESLRQALSDGDGVRRIGEDGHE